MIISEVRLDRPNARRDTGLSDLFAAHYDSLCRLAYVILGDGQLAEEIVMEAVLKTFSGWRRVRDVDRADVYLRRAVINLCRSRIRRNVVERRAMGELRSAPVAARSAIDDSETRQEVWQAVLALPQRQRVCVVLLYFEDLPEREIAELLDCSIGTVKSQLHKARAKLAKTLGPSELGGSR